ncbi:MAG: CAP domain-containing protein [Sulfurovum sp.]|nr:CAP domain-containing protein [Sulfurovum sp.]
MRFMLIIGLLAIIYWQSLQESTEISSKPLVIVNALPMDILYEKGKAYSLLNNIREAMGLGYLYRNDALDEASQGHAKYLVTQHESAHIQKENTLDFTGSSPSDRVMATDYASRKTLENLSTNTGNAQSSIDGLFAAIYHRLAFLDMSIDEVGLGVTQDALDSTESAFVYVMGNSELDRLCREHHFRGQGKYYYKVCKDEAHRIGEKAYTQAQSNIQRNNPQIVHYPYANQTQVVPAFYVETPDPLPQHDVSGMPISIAFNPYYFDKVEVLSFVLYDAQDRRIENVLLMHQANDPHQHFTDKDFALFPLERLEYDSQYRVEVEYRSKTEEQTLSWYFSTLKPREPLHTITSKETTLTLESSKSYILYFKPLNPHDMLSEIIYPLDVSVERLDNNTLKLTMSKDKRDYKIVSGDKTVYIEVE